MTETNSPSVTYDFIATNCNSTHEAIDWIDTDLAVFAGCNILYVYNVKTVNIEFSINLHKGIINTVKCITINNKNYI